MPTLDLVTLDLDAVVGVAWESLVCKGKKPRDMECWDLVYRMGMIGVLQPHEEKRLDR